MCINLTLLTNGKENTSKLLGLSLVCTCPSKYVFEHVLQDSETFDVHIHGPFEGNGLASALLAM